MAITVIQAKIVGNGGSAASITTTFDAPTTAGSIIVCAGIMGSASSSVTLDDGHSGVVTDSGQGLVLNATIGVRSYVKAFFAPASGVTAITATFGASTFCDLAIFEIAGLVSPAFDKVVQTTGTGANASSPSTGTLSAAAEAAIGYFATAGTFETGTGVGSGWTPAVGNTSSPPGAVTGTGSFAEFQVVAANTALTATAGQSASGDAYLAWCATFMSSGGTTAVGASSATGTAAATGVQERFLRPDGDSTIGTWTNELNSTPLNTSIDELIASDSDYIQSAANPTADICSVSLSNPPQGVGQPVSVAYRYEKVGSGTINLSVTLKQGSTAIASWSHSNISAAFVDALQTLSGGQFASITDPTNLFLEFQAN